MKVCVFAYLVVALCVASTLAVVDLDSSLDSVDGIQNDLKGAAPQHDHLAI